MGLKQYDFMSVPFAAGNNFKRLFWMLQYVAEWAAWQRSNVCAVWIRRSTQLFAADTPMRQRYRNFSPTDSAARCRNHSHGRNLRIHCSEHSNRRFEIDRDS